MKQKKYIIIGVIAIIIIAILCLSFSILNPKNTNEKSNEDSSINKDGLSDMKKSTPKACTNYTVEELVNHYMTNIKWTVEKNDKGYYVYNASGNLYKDDEKVNALIQFAFNDEDVIIRDFEINKISQDNIDYSELLKDMCYEMTTVEIPDVTGKTIDEAVSILQDAGFTISDEQLQTNSDVVEAGKVAKTNPPAGSKRAAGTAIILYISVSDSKIEIKDYTGQNYSEVYGYLNAFDIRVYSEKRKVKEDEFDITNPNLIIGQSVEPGTKLGAKDSITFYLPDIATKYPDFTNGYYTREDVEQFCKENGITDFRINYVRGTGKEEGTIIRQSKPEGYIVLSGTTFSIDVAEGPVEDELDKSE